MERYDSNFDHVSDFVDRWNAGVRRTRVWTIAIAILLVIAGIMSLMMPYSLYLVIQGLVSAALVVSGASRIVGYARTPELFRSTTSLVTGILNALLGVMLLALPAYLTAGTLVFLLAFLFIVSGAGRITSARRLRYFGMGETGLMTATGVLNVVAGVAFLLMPAVSSIVLSAIVSAYLIVGGLSLLVEGVAMRPIQRS